MAKTYLQQFYKLDVTKLDGSLYDREGNPEEMNLLCSSLHLDYRNSEQCILKFMLFHITAQEIKQSLWITTPVVSINEDGNFMVVTTSNSIYRFEKTDENPFETLYNVWKSRMDA